MIILIISGIVFLCLVIFLYFKFKPCTQKCGSKENPTTIPLPKCESNCYTTSDADNALESCTYNCGKGCDDCTKNGE